MIKYIPVDIASCQPNPCKNCLGRSIFLPTDSMHLHRTAAWIFSPAGTGKNKLNNFPDGNKLEQLSAVDYQLTVIKAHFIAAQTKAPYFQAALPLDQNGKRLALITAWDIFHLPNAQSLSRDMARDERSRGLVCWIIYFMHPRMTGVRGIRHWPQPVGIIRLVRACAGQDKC